MNTPIQSGRKHLFSPQSKRCTICGMDQRKVMLKEESEWCKGPTGAWPIPNVQHAAQSVVDGTPVVSTTPESTTTTAPPAQPEGFNRSAHDQFMKGL